MEVEVVYYLAMMKDLAILLLVITLLKIVKPLKVLLSNEDSYEAKLVGGDAQSDIAVLSIEKLN